MRTLDVVAGSNGGYEQIGSESLGKPCCQCNIIICMYTYVYFRIALSRAYFVSSKKNNFLSVMSRNNKHCDKQAMKEKKSRYLARKEKKKAP